MAEAARARPRRRSGDGARPTRAAVDRVIRRVGRGRVQPSGRCTTRRCRHGAVGASRSSPRSRDECEWLLANGVLPADVVHATAGMAETALRPWTPVFIHGDLQVAHIFVEGDEVAGVIDWSEASPGDAFRPGHPHAGPPRTPRRRRGRLRRRRRPRPVRAWWSLRCLSNVRWLTEHGFGAPDGMPEIALLRSVS